MKIKIEKKIGDDIFILDTKNLTLKYNSYDGNKEVKVEKNTIDFDVGKVGDGCGGGRIFLLTKTNIKAFNPENQEFMSLFENLNEAESIYKKGCDLFVQEKDAKYIYNLSMMKKYNV